MRIATGHPTRFKDYKMSRKATSKHKYKQGVKRKVRRQENADISETAPTSDISQGRAGRRFWGCGKAKK